MGHAMFDESEFGRATSDTPGPRRRWISMAVAGLSLLVFAGCPGGQQEPAADGWNYGDDTSRDVAEDTEPTDGGGPTWNGDHPEATSFQLANRTGGTIRVQVRATCKAEPPGWVSLSHASREFEPTLGRECPCSEVEDGTPCASRGEPCPAPSIEEVPTGETVNWQWSGEALVPDRVDDVACYAREIPEVGTEFQAEFCWSASSGPTGVGESLENPTCETVDFRYGEDRQVRAVAGDEGDGPQATKFVLQNSSDQRIFTRTPQDCGSPTGPWIGLRHEGERVRFGADCTVCKCGDDGLGDGCTVCERGCPTPDTQALRPDVSVTMEWSGTGWRANDDGDRRCWSEWAPDPGTSLTASFCWFDSRKGNNLSCATREFEYGADTVTFEVGADDLASPKPRDFVLRNETGGPVRIQTDDHCHPRSPAWITGLQNGEPVQFETNCEDLTCSSLVSDDTGVGCGGEPGGDCIEHAVEEVPAGETHRWSWSGHVYVGDQVDDEACRHPRVPGEGETFEVRFCWSSSSGPTGQGEQLEDPNCTEKSFGYGDDGPVELTL